MWSLIDEPCSEERSMMMHQVPSFLGTTLRGEHWRLGMGEEGKGPAV